MLISPSTMKLKEPLRDHISNLSLLSLTGFVFRSWLPQDRQSLNCSPWELYEDLMGGWTSLDSDPPLGCITMWSRVNWQRWSRGETSEANITLPLEIPPSLFWQTFCYHLWKNMAIHDVGNAFGVVIALKTGKSHIS